ncbi:MAG: GNAT family N-acetyltransferase [Planctomycetales bacterium]
MIEIRAGVFEDWTTIVEFNTRLAAETEGKTLSTAVLTQGVQNLLRDPQRGRYFVAVHDGEVVGQLMHTWEWSDWRNGFFWWIQSVYIHADYRGQGVFRALFQHLEREAREAGDVVGLRLYVETHNDEAHAVYEKLQMVPAGYLVREKFLSGCA